MIWLSFSASAWKVFSVSLYRKDSVWAWLASVWKSSHCLQRKMTGGPFTSLTCNVSGFCSCVNCVSIWEVSCEADRYVIRFAISFCSVVSLSSTFSIFPLNAPVSPSFSVMPPNSFISLSKSFSCSFKTFTMKSRASKASFFDGGFLDIALFLFLQPINVRSL